MINIRFAYKTAVPFLLFFFVISGCKSFKKDAIRVVSLYVYAYSTGNKDILKNIFSNKLLKSYPELILFFNSPDFQRTKSELHNHRVIVTAIKKVDSQRYRVNYQLILADKKSYSDTLYLVEENDKLKIDETGMFAYR